MNAYELARLYPGLPPADALRASRRYDDELTAATHRQKRIDEARARRESVKLACVPEWD